MTPKPWLKTIRVPFQFSGTSAIQVAPSGRVPVRRSATGAGAWGAAVEAEALVSERTTAAARAASVRVEDERGCVRP